MISPVTVLPATILHRISVCLLTGALLGGTGCVAQQTYDQTMAEASQMARSLDSTLAEVQDLDQQIVELQTANRRQDSIATELRAAIKREKDLMPIRRQRAEDKIASLQSQITNLINQNRLMIKQMADLKQSNASLQATSVQYKQEIDELKAAPLPVATITLSSTQPSMTANTPSLTPPQQMAQVSPAVPPMKQVSPPRPAKVEPSPEEDSWSNMITKWLASLWSWLFDF